MISYKTPKKSPDYEENRRKKRTCLLMYSGGVDTSTCVFLLREYYGYQVITCTIDLLQNSSCAQEMAKKAKTLGAIKTIIFDAKKMFAETMASRVIKANALYDDKYPLGTSLARPFQAKIVSELAKKEKVDAVAHGCRGKGTGSDSFRLNFVFNYLLPRHIKLVMPICDWWPTRKDIVEFANEHKIPIPVKKNNPFSYDDTLLSLAINYGDIDDPTKPIPEEAFKWTLPINKTKNRSDKVTIGFKSGLPISINNKKMHLADILHYLNELGGKHGIGRKDMIENGLFGNKFRWVYECPAADILITAHQELEKLTLPKETLYFKHEKIDKKWTKLAYNSSLFSPLANALMKFIDYTQQFVNGQISLSLLKGNIIILKRESSNSLLKTKVYDLIRGNLLDTIPFGYEELNFTTTNKNTFGKFFDYSNHPNKGR